MKQRYFIRELALTDLEEIWLFTLSEWSVEQADAYTSSILARLNWLADNPSAGTYSGGTTEGSKCCYLA